MADRDIETAADHGDPVREHHDKAAEGWHWVQVADELVEQMRDRWSPPVQVKITNDVPRRDGLGRHLDLIMRTYPDPHRDKAAAEMMAEIRANPREQEELRRASRQIAEHKAAGITVPAEAYEAANAASGYVSKDAEPHIRAAVAAAAPLIAADHQERARQIVADLCDQCQADLARLTAERDAALARIAAALDLHTAFKEDPEGIDWCDCGLPYPCRTRRALAGGDHSEAGR